MTKQSPCSPRHRRPIANSYAVPGAPFYAGEYPGALTDAAARAKVMSIVDAGVTAFVDLTGPEDRMKAYAPLLRSLAAERGATLSYDQHPIPDNDVCSDPEMYAILDTIDRRIAAGEVVYVHCWGGVGRTGTVVGCWLVRRGWGSDDALREVGALFRSMSPEKVRRHAGTGSPQTSKQREMIKLWCAEEDDELQALLRDLDGDVTDEISVDPIAAAWSVLAPAPHITIERRDRMRGALIGLAVGDAVGTTAEFSAPGSFPAVTDMMGGGPFRLPAGAWTDDTSMALCLAESLLTCNTFDARDQMERYVRWWQEGYLSSTAKCFDIGTTVRAALARFVETKDPMAGSTDPQTAGNGSLMRLAPVPLFYAARPAEAIRLAGESSRTTHATPVAVDACRYFAGLLVGALSGISKEELLSPQYTPVAGGWDEAPLHPTVAAIADGSFKVKAPPAIRGSGYVADSLEAALWAFHVSSDFQSGCLLAVNLGEDADTTAAIFGQIAGAYYGESAIPQEWRAKLARKPLLDEMAESLFQHAFQSTVLGVSRARQARTAAEEWIGEASGDPLEAIRVLFANEDEIRRELGVMAFVGGPMHRQAVRDHTLLHLRIAAALRLMAPGDTLR